MDLELRDRTVIVTGGGAGIGGAITLALAREGAVPVVFGRSALHPDFEHALRTLQPRARFRQLHMEDEAACRTAVQATLDEFGALHGLVNNAGVNDGVGLDAGRDAFVGSLESQVLTQARRFSELSVDHEGRELPQLEPLDTLPRPLAKLAAVAEDDSVPPALTVGRG